VKIKPKSKSTKKKRRWYDPKPPRSMGRLAQLGKVLRKRRDSETVAKWKELDDER
jgi:hypothetical protein